MRRGNTRPAELEISAGTTTLTDDDHAVVEVGVQPIRPDTNGGATSYTADQQTWTFITHHGNGWQIEKVEPFAWCGGYVTAQACKAKQ
jgi:hypothetical protein